MQQPATCLKKGGSRPFAEDLSACVKSIFEDQRHHHDVLVTSWI